MLKHMLSVDACVDTCVGACVDTCVDACVDVRCFVFNLDRFEASGEEGKPELEASDSDFFNNPFNFHRKKGRKERKKERQHAGSCHCIVQGEAKGKRKLSVE